MNKLACMMLDNMGTTINVGKMPEFKRLSKARQELHGVGFFGKTFHHKNAHIGFNDGDSFIGNCFAMNPN